MIVSISSLSCSDAKASRPWNVLIPFYATLAVITRAKKAVKMIVNSGCGFAGISLHAGFATLIKMFRYSGLQITSGDLPDVNWFVPKYIWQVVRDLFLAPWMTPQHIGWRVNSVGTRGMLQKKIEELLEVITPVGGKGFPKLILRWNQGSIDYKVLDWLKEKYSDNILVLLEHDFESSTFCEYLEWFCEVKSQYSFVALTFDGAKAHLGNDGDAVSAFKMIVKSDLVSQLAMVELNQIAKKDEKEKKKIDNSTHTGLFEGLVDYETIFDLYAEAHKKDRLHYLPHIVIESHPSNFDKLLKEGCEYLTGIRKKFEGGALN